MTTQIERSIAATGGTGLPRSSVLAWIVGLAAALTVPFLLPLSGSPIALAGFFGLSGVLILFARHWLIAVLPVLAALGPYFLELQAAGINVFGFRLLIMLLAVFSTPLTTRGDWWFNPVARNAVLFLLLWLMFGLLSLLWTPDFGGGIGDIFTIVFGLGLLLTLLSLNAHKAGHLDKLRFGWLIALAAAAGSAAIEIVTGNGLPKDLTAEVGTSSVSLQAAALYDPAVTSTFGFSNQFGGFLVLTVPFVLWSLEKSRGVAKAASMAMLLGVGVLILYSASRLSLIALILQLGCYGLVLRRRWYMPFVVLGGAVVATVLYATVIVDSDLRIAEKFNTAAESGGTDASIRHRMALTLNGLWMVYKTGGRGIGAAGFEEEIGGDVPFLLPIRYRSTWNAHNFWIEVLSEYGVLPFIAFMALLAWIGQLAWRAQRRRGPGDEAAPVGRALVLGLLGYVFYCVTAGSPLEQAFHWMFLVSLLVMAAFLHDELRRQRRALAPSGLEWAPQTSRAAGPVPSNRTIGRPSH